jgi:hypothetical protein
MQQTILRDIILDSAIPQNTGRQLATEVEQCVCPPGNSFNLQLFLSNIV